MGITTTALKPLACEPPGRRGRQIVSHEEGGSSYLVDHSPADSSATPAPGLCAASSRDLTTGSDTTCPHAPTFKLRPTRNRRKSSPRSTTNPENTPTKQHQPKPTNTPQNHTTTVLHFKLEQGPARRNRGRYHRRGHRTTRPQNWNR